MIRALSGGLVEIHGQHDERALMDASTHRALIDAYGALERCAEATKAAFGALKAVEAEHTAESARVAAPRPRPISPLTPIRSSTRLAARPEEEEALAERRSQMMQAEKVSADIREAHEILSGDASPTRLLAAAARRLNGGFPKRRR